MCWLVIVNDVTGAGGVKKLFLLGSSNAGWWGAVRSIHGTGIRFLSILVSQSPLVQFM